MENRRAADYLRLKFDWYLDKRKSKENATTSTTANSNPNTNGDQSKTSGSKAPQLPQETTSLYKNTFNTNIVVVEQAGLSHFSNIISAEDEPRVYKQFLEDIENLYFIQKYQLDDCFKQLTSKLVKQQKCIALM